MKLARVTYENSDMKLTELIRSTVPGFASVFVCENINEFNSAKTTAYNVKQEEREDGYKYSISLDSKRMTVSVSLTEP